MIYFPVCVCVCFFLLPVKKLQQMAKTAFFSFIRSRRPLLSSSGVPRGPCRGSAGVLARMSGAGEIYYISDDDEEEATSAVSNGDGLTTPK